VLKVKERCRIHKKLDWQRFVKGQICQREEYEEALEACRHCLEAFQDVLETELTSVPSGFTDNVMAGLPDREATGLFSRLPALKPWLHYLVAASLTLAFLQFGVFDQLPALPGQLLPQQILPERAYTIGSMILEKIQMILAQLRVLNLGG
jgi:hypothetical protein